MPKHEIIITMGLSLKVHSEDTVYPIVHACKSGLDLSVVPGYISRCVWVKMGVVKRLPMGVTYFCCLKQVSVLPDTERHPSHKQFARCFV